jgi:hypothetical protein|eukprot:COSAG01_NODE_2358_length_7838_cov_7.568807_5_plen_289_part_00
MVVTSGAAAAAAAALLALSLVGGPMLGCGSFPPPGAGGWRPPTHNPVLVPDNATWEHTAVQEPQVVFVPEQKLMRMWYRGAGWGFPSGLGVADSTDLGRTWQRYARNPVWGARGIPGEGGGQPWIYREGPGQYWLYTTFSNAHGAGKTATMQIAKSGDGLAWTNVSVGAVPLPSAHDARPAADRAITGTMFGNRAVWKEANGKWHMLQECGTSEGVWEVFLYAGSSATEWRVRAGPLRTLQRHSRSMFGGCHIATVGEYTRTATSTILNCDTLYRAYGLSAPMLLTQL